MKICLFIVCEDIITKELDEINNISSKLFIYGFDIEEVSYLKNDKKMIEERLIKAKEKGVCVFFICDEKNSLSCKKIISDVFNCKLTINQFAKKNIEEFSNCNNLKVEEKYSFELLPENSRCIKNSFSFFQPFLMEEKEKSFLFLPIKNEELNKLFSYSVLPFLHQKYSNNKIFVLKTIGLNKENLMQTLKDFLDKDGIQIKIKEKNLICDLGVMFSKNIKEETLKENISKIYSSLSNYIFSEEDGDLLKLLFELLILRKKNIAFAEDFTCGNLSKVFYERFEEANKVVKRSIFLPSDSLKIKELNVNESIFKKIKIDLSEICYEMALGLLDKSNSDIVVANCGDLKSGEFVFAIGSRDGIYIYSDKVEGNFCDKIQSSTNKILYKLFLKLKEDKFFNVSKI